MYNDRIPLEERLMKHKSFEANFLNIFEVYIDDYYSGLFDISQNPYFKEYREKHIFTKENGSPYIMSQFISCLDELSEGRKDYFLYHTLIEPFVKIQTFERRN